ncbi:MAG: helix-turn-helix domain-containing protein [Proteobacteria bacterium]|nr:helix-turn-helix domain-containing protein [Pseudomonadota bacterium]
MDCRHIEFSAEKSHQRLERYRRVFSPALLNRILALALHLLGVKRQAIAALVGMPEESVKTILRTVQNHGFPALRDRRFSDSRSSARVQASAREPKVSLHIDGEFCVVDVGIAGKEIRILRDHQVHLRTLLLSLCQGGLVTASEASAVLGITPAHCRELARKLARDDVVETLVDQRQGQKQDYLVGAEIKAQIIQHFAALAVTGGSTSGHSLAQVLSESNAIDLSPRTIRWHMHKLGLNTIKKTLPELVERLKKTAEHSR